MQRFFLAAITIILNSVTPSGEKASLPAPLQLVLAARTISERQVAYDGRYRVIKYPGGDPGHNRGGSSDLVIRAYRKLGIDLQVLVHQDIKENFDLYPAKTLYTQTGPDANIDHRRVPNLMVFYKRHAESLTLSLEPEHLNEWQPGDLVIFDLLDNGIPSHIGIVSDKKAESDLPLVIHHFPSYPSEDDCLRKWKVAGHFRYFPDQDKVKKDK